MGEVPLYPRVGCTPRKAETAAACVAVAMPLARCFVHRRTLTTLLLAQEKHCFLHKRKLTRALVADTTGDQVHRAVLLQAFSLPRVRVKRLGPSGTCKAKADAGAGGRHHGRPSPSSAPSRYQGGSASVDTRVEVVELLSKWPPPGIQVRSRSSPSSPQTLTTHPYTWN